ncbi:protein kinase [Candidatus Uabimicrobium sp. HlEnr_7]|uniref:protein kinase domain-containing protein n=1 Tax=Candidatus Uabimicrobium helgolandensis TaxID=3095367 RepID=UPI0035576EE1
MKNINEDILNKICDPGATFDNDQNWESMEQRQTLIDENASPNDTIDVDFSNTSSIAMPHNLTNYNVEKQIGEGGMAVVFEGWQKNLQRSVAIKNSKKSCLSQNHKFIAEAIITAFLNHPNIVPVYDLFRDNDNLFMSMKLVAGTTWMELLAEPKRKSEKEHIQILISVCNAIAFAHSKDIIHCDLKPENIIIGEFGEVFVMDWGLAVDISEDHSHLCLSKSDVVGAMGTPSYIAPELLAGNGQNIGRWTDIYLLGGILYRIFSGSPPHCGEDIRSTLLQSLEGDIKPLPDHIHPSIANICYKALSLEPKDRYQNVKEFQQELNRFLEHKESITISNNAHNKLKSISKETSKDDMYEKFQDIISAFQQSLLLWPNNETAVLGEDVARLDYAQLALSNKEFALAQSQIAKVTAKNKGVTALQQKITKSAHKHQNTQKIIRRLYWGVAILLFAVSVILVSTIFTMQHQHERAALKTAKFFVKSLNQIRSKYSNEIVAKLKLNPQIKVSHDPKNINEIPFPATFTISFAKEIDELGEKGHGLHVELYSEYPFPWRAQNEFDSFQKNIFASIKKNPSITSFAKIEKMNGRSYLRYSEAVPLKKSCVNCHNNHPQSPKTDWKEGDVRGIQEVSVPIETIGESIQKIGSLVKDKLFFNH